MRTEKARLRCADATMPTARSIKPRYTPLIDMEGNNALRACILNVSQSHSNRPFECLSARIDYITRQIQRMRLAPRGNQHNSLASSSNRYLHAFTCIYLHTYMLHHTSHHDVYPHPTSNLTSLTPAIAYLSPMLAFARNNNPYPSMTSVARPNQSQRREILCIVSASTTAAIRRHYPCNSPSSATFDVCDCRTCSQSVVKQSCPRIGNILRPDTEQASLKSQERLE